jgi:HD-like signal output (HDOD) protein
MKRILFVDDEVKLLDGLRRLLRANRKDWDVSFAASGAEALALMDANPVDVVVTDMRMPGMDGAALLEQVSERHPTAIRIVLSGHFEVEAGLRAIPVAHQFLAKPCDPEILKAAIERSSQLSFTAPDAATRRAIGAIGALPSPSRTCILLTEAVRDPSTSLDEVARIIADDVALTAKVLQLVNSAFFHIAREIPDIRSAISCLGLDLLREVVLASEMLRAFQPVRGSASFSLDALERHSRLTARIAVELCESQSQKGFAAMSGLLHDTGTLVLAARLPAKFEEAAAMARLEQRPRHECETTIFGACHAKIGAYLLNLWGLPASVVEAIAFHHKPRPEPRGQRGLSLGALTHVADILAHEIRRPASIGKGIPADLDESLAQRFASSDWRERARRAAGLGVETR